LLFIILLSVTDHNTEPQLVTATVLITIMPFVLIQLVACHFYCVFRMSKKPQLNLQHGFIKAIRRQLKDSAQELGMSPVENPTSSTVVHTTSHVITEQPQKTGNVRNT